MVPYRIKIKRIYVQWNYVHFKIKRPKIYVYQQISAVLD